MTANSADPPNINPNSEIEAHADGESFVLELARSKREFVVHEGESILEILLEAGINVAFSCEQGICGSCETAVIAGVPEHRDSILSDEERAENKTVMICCAGCKSERLVIDL